MSIKVFDKSVFIVVFFSIFLGVGKVLAQDNDSSSAEDTPVILEEISAGKEFTGIRPWRPPEYLKQENALGWSPGVFEVPKGLEVNYTFWLDVYTKYTTDQGLIHDSEYIDLIYEVLNFSTISSRADLSNAQKNAHRLRLVNESKKRVKALLKKLQNLQEPSSLTQDEKRIWDYFQKISGEKKFEEATSKKRIRFQLGQRDRMIQGIFYSGRYLEDFEKIFREAGLPIELTRLPFVESSFNVLARSRVGASGLWQIMRATGKPYMMINKAIDKRNFPLEATRLVTRIFRYNYNMLKSWPLAVTGYNHGPAGVLRLTRIHKSQELGDLMGLRSLSNSVFKDSSRGTRSMGKRRLGFASRNFYISFLSALEAEKNAAKYFGSIYWSQPLNGVEVRLSKAVQWKDILELFDGNDKMAQVYNPHITSSARRFGYLIPRKSVVYLLKDKNPSGENFLPF